MRILFCAQDPGGTNALLPVIKKLQLKEQVEIFSGTFAADMFRTQGISSIDCTQLAHTQIEQRFSAFNPDIVLMGTSAELSIEKKVTLIAKKRNIPSIAMMDAWINYSIRFSSNDKPHDLRYLPDFICVIDKRMRQEMINEGIPRMRIVVTGNPYFYECMRFIKPHYGALRATKKKQIVFISQPLSVAPYNHLGFDEFEVLSDLLSYPHLGAFRALLIKLHPKEETGKFNNLLAQWFPIPVEITQQNVYELISQSPLIIGMNSTILFEAGLAGGVVISYQPRQEKTRDTLMSNRLSISKGLYHKKQFYQTLDTVLKGTIKKNRRVATLRKRYTSSRSITNVINLLYEK